jgi:hypothetical protein
MGGGTQNYSTMPRNLLTGYFSKQMYFPCLNKKDTCAQIVSRLYEHVVHWRLLAVKSVRNKFTIRKETRLIVFRVFREIIKKLLRIQCMKSTIKLKLS